METTTESVARLESSRRVLTLCAEELADENASLLEQVQAYRALALEAIALLQDLTQQLERQRATHHQLIDEYRRLRETLTRGAVAA